MAGFTDIADYEEDIRIQMIGAATMTAQRAYTSKPMIVGFVVDDDEKAQRYIDKLTDKFPGIRVLSRGKGPVRGTVLVRVGPPVQ